MKERPILFSSVMVRAILAGAKTQTRRVVKPQPQWGCVDDAPQLGDGFLWWPRGKKHERWNNPCGEHDLARSMAESPFAYAQPGDTLWVRETWQPIWSTDRAPSSMKSPEGWAIGYTATDGVQEYRDDEHGLTTRCKPAIFMPRWASRITLEVTGVRVERLQDISGDDVIAEGIDGKPHMCGCEVCRMTATLCPATETSLGLEYADLWRSINGADSWDANPWVWVVEFRRVEAQERAA
jgi:hypothetical protein